MEKEALSQENTSKLGDKELYSLVTSQEVSWQSIIYELVASDQLDPWNLDLACLAQKYIEKIKELEEANFLISSKVLLAASILLRLKSDILLHKYLRNIDEILFGKEEKESKPVERIEIDESELPILYPKTPLPRYKRVSLQELIDALEHAMKTETRRIKKEVVRVQQEKSAETILPKTGKSVKNRIRELYAKILTSFKKKPEKIPYTHLSGIDKEERIACFLPCLHLENQQKVFLEQEKHFSEIYIWLYNHYKKLNPNVGIVPELKEQETGFGNPLADFFGNVG